jgi:hypothetical protein
VSRTCQLVNAPPLFDTARLPIPELPPFWLLVTVNVHDGFGASVVVVVEVVVVVVVVDEVLGGVPVTSTLSVDEAVAPSSSVTVYVSG